jgi:hypothetical protein
MFSIIAEAIYFKWNNNNEKTIVIEITIIMML